MEVLKFYRVETIRGALLMRKIRNECREFMTQDTSKIGILRQLRWFYQVYKPSHLLGDMVAYIGMINNKPVAYGIIRNKLYRPVISGGVSEQFRGEGVGRLLFEKLMREASRVQRIGDKSVFLEVLETNIPAQNLYTSLGFVEKHREQGIIFMQKDWGEFDR